MTIPGYQLGELLHSGQKSMVHRAVRASDGQRVILKVPASPHPSLDEQQRAKREFAVLSTVHDRHIVPALELVRHRGALILVTVDDGAQSLTRTVEEGQACDLSRFLVWAQHVVGALAKLHEGGWVHRDINPNNIVIRPDGTAALIDLGLVERVAADAVPCDALVGTAAWLAPEQTGRMNRHVDHRADFYALGCTFYWLLSGRQPFASTDLLELIHCHIARQPTPLTELRQGIPPVIAGIVDKLMAKAPEGRYQSANGLLVDLRRAATQLDQTGLIEPFELACADLSTHFQVPDKLYGRDQEIAAILDAFAQVTEGALPRLVAVAGHSGSGKSRLVREVMRPIAAHRGMFAAGKFDQFQRGTPLAPILTALDDVVRELLSQDEARVTRWRAVLNEALGANLSLMVEVVPTLLPLLGPGRPVADLPPMEAQLRFAQVFRQFVAALCAPEHPMVLFLDDVQWADSATLVWLEDILTRHDVRGLMLMVAFRDNEVGADHPLAMLIKRLLEKDAPLVRVDVGPLPTGALRELVADALHDTADTTRPLCEELQRATGGNPFFVGQMLRHFALHGALQHDRERHCWAFDRQRLGDSLVPDDVVQLLVGRLARLPAPAHKAMAVASIVGARFQVTELASLMQLPAEVVREQLEAPVAEGLLIAPDLHGNSQFRFLHDRVQQAARQGLKEEQAQQLRLSLGRSLLGATESPEHNTRLFDIVGHLQAGLSLVTDADEKKRIGALHFAAARRAREAGAFGVAREHAASAMDLAAQCGDTGASRQAMDRALERAICEHLAGDNTEAEKYFVLAHGAAPDVITRADAYEAQANFFTNLGRFADAYQTARKGAAELGVKMPARFVPPLLIKDLIAVRLTIGSRDIATLAGLPAVRDEKIARAFQLCGPALKAAYQIRPELCVHNAARLVRLAIKYGNSRDIPVAYFVFGGIFLGGVMGLHDRGRDFANLALNLVDKYDALHQKAEVHFIAGYFAHSWWNPTESTEALWRIAYQTGKETGDNFHASCAASGTVQSMLMRGAPLDSIQDRLEAFTAFLENADQSDGMAVMGIVGGAVAALQGRTPSLSDWSLPNKSDAEIEASLAGFGSRHFAHFYAVDKAMTLVLGGRPEDAVSLLVKSAPYLKDSTGMIHAEEHRFWLGMASAMAHQAKPSVTLAPVRSAVGRLAKCARDCAANFKARHLLLEAELARSSRDESLASARYEEAIEAASQAGHLHIEALANERAGTLHLGRGRTRTARFFLAEALWCYERWGAVTVAARLRDAYPELAAESVLRHAGGASLSLAKADSVSTSTSSHAAGGTARLDMVSIMKFADEINSEISLAGLLRRLLMLLLEAAGAQRGVLVLSGDDGLRVEAEGRADGAIEVLQSRSLHAFQDLPHSIVHLALRTGKPVVLADAQGLGMSSDPYLLRGHVRSVLAMALSEGGQDVGVIYLEHSDAPGAFTDNRLQLLGLLSGQMAISIRNARLYDELEDKVRQRTADIERESERAENLLLNILPRSTAAELKSTGSARTRSYDLATVLFCDFTNFTKVASGLTPEALIRMLDAAFCAFDDLVATHQIEKIKTIGDAYMCVGGLPMPDTASVVRTVLCGLQMVAHIEREHALRGERGEPFWRCRIGVHTGPVVAGVVGKKKFAYDVWGDTVNTASRMESHGRPGAVCISPTTQQLVESFFVCESLGVSTVKGKGDMEMFQVLRLRPELSDDEVGLHPNAAFALRLADWRAQHDDSAPVPATSAPRMLS